MALTILALVVCAAAVASGQSREGICSWYGAEGEIPPGWPTASGEPFDRHAMAAATWSEVPFGKRLRVTNLENGQSVQVKVNDRFGGAPKDRIVDLTYGAFGRIANRDKGLRLCGKSSKASAIKNPSASA